MQAGRELDAMVAEKVMGWKRMRWCDWKQDERTSLTYSWHDVDGKMVKLAENSDDYEDPRPAWSPSTSIADAWEVVEKLSGREKLPMRVQIDNGYDKPWVVTISSWKTGQEWHGESESLPLAICRAALKAVGR